MAKKINAHNARKAFTVAFQRQFVNPASHLIEQGMREHVNNVLDISKPLVPVSTGALLSSGKAATQIQKNKIEGAVAYGSTSIVTSNAPQGTTSHYAVVVHETHTTQSKYLERAVNSGKDEEQKVIFKPLRDYLK